MFLSLKILSKPQVWKNSRVPAGGKKNSVFELSGWNPKPNISWYRGCKVTKRQICSGEKLEARESGCYNYNHSCKHHLVLAVAAWFPVTCFRALWGHMTCSLTVSASILKPLLLARKRYFTRVLVICCCCSSPFPFVDWQVEVA